MHLRLLGNPLSLPNLRLLTLGFLLVASTWTSAGTITVDLAVEEGFMNHRANGYLVSMEPTRPSMHLILPLKPTSFRGSVRHVLQNYARLKEAGVSEVQLTLGYIFHDLAMQVFDINQIGKNGDFIPWLTHVDHVIDQVLDRQLFVLWDIYNEPDLAGSPFAESEALMEGWRVAYQRIKQRVPGAIIVGPSVSRYRFLWPFLDWSHTEGVFPDVVSYHEYGDPSGAIAYVDGLREYLSERALGRPISVNETAGQESWTLAGYTAGVLAAYERADILSAMRACWPDPQDTSRFNIENTCNNSTLDGLLYVDGQAKRPGWHIYKTYADMQGTKVSARTDSPKLHALAALDGPSGSLRVLMGKYGDYSTEDTHLVLKNLDRIQPPGQKHLLHLCAEQIPDVGSGPLRSAVLTLDTDMPQEEGDLSITLPQFGHSDAYRVLLSPLGKC